MFALHIWADLGSSCSCSSFPVNLLQPLPLPCLPPLSCHFLHACQYARLQTKRPLSIPHKPVSLLKDYVPGFWSLEPIEKCVWWNKLACPKYVLGRRINLDSSCCLLLQPFLLRLGESCDFLQVCTCIIFLSDEKDYTTS